MFVIYFIKKGEVIISGDVYKDEEIEVDKDLSKAEEDIETSKEKIDDKKIEKST